MGLSVYMNATSKRKQSSGITLNILDQIGYWGLLKVVWYATPTIGMLTLPYGLWVYGAFLRQSSNLRELLRLHDYACHVSLAFRLLRPRYYRAANALERYGIK